MKTRRVYSVDCGHGMAIIVVTRWDAADSVTMARLQCFTCGADLVFQPHAVAPDGKRYAEKEE